MNDEVKSFFKKMRIPQWQVADELGIGESVFSRRLRYELDEDAKRKVYEAVHQIAKRRAQHDT